MIGGCGDECNVIGGSGDECTVIGGCCEDLTFCRTSVRVPLSSQMEGSLEEHAIVIVRTLTVAPGREGGREGKERASEREIHVS